MSSWDKCPDGCRKCEMITTFLSSQAPFPLLVFESGYPYSECQPELLFDTIQSDVDKYAVRVITCDSPPRLLCTFI